ncbi:hypothetical protein FF38_05411, partial [Lucilia cuprina]
VRPTLPAVAAGAQQQPGGSDPVQGAVAGDGEDVEVLFPGERDRFPRGAGVEAADDAEVGGAELRRGGRAGVPGRVEGVTGSGQSHRVQVDATDRAGDGAVLAQRVQAGVGAQQHGAVTGVDDAVHMPEPGRGARGGIGLRRGGAAAREQQRDGDGGRDRQSAGEAGEDVLHRGDLGGLPVDDLLREGGHVRVLSVGPDGRTPHCGSGADPEPGDQLRAGRSVPDPVLRAGDPGRDRAGGADHRPSAAGGRAPGRGRGGCGDVGGAVRDPRRPDLPCAHPSRRLLLPWRGPVAGALHLGGRDRDLRCDPGRAGRDCDRHPSRRDPGAAVPGRARAGDAGRPGGGAAGELLQPGAVRPAHRLTVGVADRPLSPRDPAGDPGGDPVSSAVPVRAAVEPGRCRRDRAARASPSPARPDHAGRRAESGRVPAVVRGGAGGA